MSSQVTDNGLAAQRRLRQRVAIHSAFFTLLTAFGVLAAEPGAPAGAAGESVRTTAEQTCGRCHDSGDTAASDIAPNLAGQQAAYLRKQLRALKSHARSGEGAVRNMWQVAHDLDERQIDELAAWFAAQPQKLQAVQGTHAAITAGQAIYARGASASGVPACSACHGVDAQGKDTVPLLAGQRVGYLIRQLQVLQQTNDRPGAAEMRPFVHKLTAEDIENVAAYLQALPEISAR